MKEGRAKHTICVETASNGRMARMAVDRVQALLGAGVQPADILVVAATQTVARELGRAGCSEAGSVVTFDELAGAVLAHDGAAERLGRSARVLTPMEEKVLAEDMLVTGLKPGRLREMLSFLFRGLSEGRRDDESWLVNNEERSLLAFLTDHLAERGAILSCERGDVACACLETFPDVLKAFAVPHVIVCGYPALDARAQRFVRLLATESLAAVGSGRCAGERSIAYPHLQGMDELAADGARLIDADAEELAVSDALRRALCACVDDAAPLELGGSERAASAHPELFVSACLDERSTPEDEARAVAAYVESLVEGGAAPQEIVVAVPNAAYARRVSDELAAAGVPLSPQAGIGFSQGDPRKMASAGPARFAAGLGIVADAQDVASWRTWLGAGDSMLRSESWELLRQVAAEAQTGIVGAIELVREALGPSQEVELGPGAAAAARFAGPLSGAQRMFAACAGLQGSALIEALGTACEWTPAGADRAALEATDGTPAAMASAMRARCRDAACPDDGVVVALYDDCRGRVAAHLVVCGMVDGYLPRYAACSDDETHERRHRFQREERRRLLSLLACADETVAFGLFREAEAEVADRSKVDVGRFFVRKGNRLATAKPSSLLREALGE